MKTVESMSQFAVVRRGENRNAISAIPGIQLQSSHHGTFNSGDVCAEIQIQTANELLLTTHPKAKIRSQQALELTHRLPGNLRFALDAHELKLIANFLTQPREQLGETFAEIGCGLALVDGHAVEHKANDDRKLSTAQIVDALQPLGSESQSIVELATGWELRPLVANRPIAVKLNCKNQILRFHHVILTRLDNAGANAVAQDLALRLNHRFRYARLSLVAGQIVSETNLRIAQFSGPSVAEAVQAVAVTAHRARTVLQILNTNPDIAACYAAMFGCAVDCDESFAAD
jgi:hypothetical protein